MHVELPFAQLASHFVHHGQTVVVKGGNKRLEDVHMERGCDELPVIPPLLPRTDQQSISQPRLEEPILVRLVQVNVTVQDDLNVCGVRQEDHQFVADPTPGDVAVDLAQLDGKFQNFWENEKRKFELK